jgi:hypothetical protein
MKRRKRIWRLWAKALGEKATKNDREADHVASIRTFLFLSYLLTNLFIVAGVIRHWNDSTIIIIENEVPSTVFETKEKGLL